MTATRIVELGDESTVLETFDFRSEFAFDEFSEWIGQTLRLQPDCGIIREDMPPFSFDWNGPTFQAAWSEEHGCFIKAPPGFAGQLRQMQSALAA